MNFKTLLITICLFGFVQPCLASDLKLVVSPPLTELTLKPGEVAQKIIKVTNNGTTQVALHATISDFIVQDDNGTPIKVQTQASGRYLASPWFILNQEDINIAPQATQEIIVIIQAPADALPGGHYAGVFFTPKSTSQLTTTGATIVPEIGSLFELTVPGNINYDAIIESFEVDQSIYEYGPINFTAKIANQSDTHITPNPEIIIQDMFGRTLTAVTLPSLNIFPFTSRTLVGNWDNVWGLGRYTAQLIVPYGPNFVISRVLHFWIIPYRLIGSILVIVLAFIACYTLINSKRRHLADTRDEQIDSLKRRIIELENKK